ncbi:hypothetical protein DMC47_03460 [Nostoc sp. 3335mG]|nr:hypothetical protein DMC47_03460 [Nostoc sp. 3335mG]
MKFRNLGILTNVVATMVAVQALNRPIVLAWIIVSPESLSEHFVRIGDAYQGAFFLLFVLTIIAFAWWIYVAGANLEALGHQDLNFTAESRVWWFAVPFANLVMPYRGMRELWTVSHGDPEHPDTGLVALWWALWLSNGVAGLILVQSDEQAMTMLWVVAVLAIALAAVAIAILRGITKAQNRIVAGELEEVFA